MADRLRTGVQKLSLDLSEVQLEQLTSYIYCVLEFNKSYNLMKADSSDELSVNHVLDSLVALPYIRKETDRLSKENMNETVKIGDIGSGGGCPGIPLAVAMPDVSFTLVERMEKRCAFLETAVSKLGLSNVRILCRQADKVPPESFDIEVFRAFHPFDTKIVKLLFEMLKPHGTIMAYKARSERICAEMESVNKIIPLYEKISLTVPFLEDHERNLVVIRKG